MTSRTPAVAGFLIAGALLLAIGYIANRQSSVVGDVAPDLPPLSITAPASSDTVRNPIELRFTTPAQLELTRDGWTADDMHLHLMIDGNEVMPAATDITATSGAFVWRLPLLDSGTHRLYLTWAARHHGNLAGVTDTLSLFVTR
jgi:hypothetical protein